MILAELSGTLAGRLFSKEKNPNKREGCVRIWPMSLPFLSGFLGCYGKVSMIWGSVRQLGPKRIRLISSFFTTVLLFVPAVSFYFEDFSLSALLLCGLLLYVAIRELDPVYSSYMESGTESSESFSMPIMKPIQHVLSERKSRKIALFLLINAGYMVVEFVSSFMSNSLGLISDACHMLFDCAALPIGVYALYISRLPANSQFNYGRGRFDILSGYVNAVFLVLVGALIVLESFERILDPQEISTNSLLTVSIGGVVVNVVGLIFFHEEHHHAHGGSCSHSHSHPDSHPHDHHHQHSYDHGNHVEHHEFINVCDGCHDSCSSHEHHHSNQHHSNNYHGEDHKKHEFHGHHDHDHNQAPHDCAHHHDPQDHGRKHDHVHSLDNHDCVHHHDHHDRGHKLAHGHNHDLHDFAHHHDHHHYHHDQGLHLHSHYSEPKGHLPQKHKHGHIDHNMEGIFLHVLADTMGSVGVVVSTLLIKYEGWLVADPACSIFISVLIISSVIPLLRNSAEILLQRVPRAQEQGLKKAISEITNMKGVCRVQNLHVWCFTDSDIIGTVHLHITAETDKAAMESRVSLVLHDAGIKDLTLQVERVVQ
ncbi:Metal tolerance protein 8 [Hibiscus syriacus]|uniref:Metal tolerance protein 8 n=1 Tax=Hibiscus syriacus TaxID=106335 RepID=A0A6A3BT58_HIBSY|nr:Metal tolerance protein 8 [Hibiscus syriacus]